MSDELPHGWATVRLEELTAEPTAITYGVLKPGPITKDGVPMLRVMNIVNGRVDDADLYKISRDLARQYDRTKLRGGEVVVSVQGSVGRVAIVPNNLVGANISRTLAVIPPVEPSLANWIWAMLQTPQVQSQIVEVTGGTTRDSLNLRDLRVLQIPLPPVGEQRRIVTKLERLFGQVDDCQQRLARVPALLKRFRQSVLAAACSGRLTADWREENPSADDSLALVTELEHAHEEAGGHKQGNAAPPTDEAHDLTEDELPTSWRIIELRTAVCPDRPITYGILKPGPDAPGGVLYVRVADFPNDKLNLASIRRTTTTIEQAYARARLREGDILLSIRGTVGRVCVVPRELQGANITQDTARLSIQPALNADYVKWFLRADPTQKRMQKAIRGVAVRGINIGDVRALQVPVPPPQEQKEIVHRVERLFALTDRLEARYAEGQKRVDSITQSLLAKAFRGELVPTEFELAKAEGRTFESAEELLERIKRGGATQKQAIPQKGMRSKRELKRLTTRN